MNSEIKKYSFKEGLPQEFELINIGELYKESSATLTTPHRTGFYHILWFQEGSPIHTVDFNPVKIEPNTLLFLNKDIVQGFDKKGHFDGVALLFTENFFCKTEQDTNFLKSTILFNDLLTVSKIEIAQPNPIFSDLLNLMKTELHIDKDRFQSDILKNLLHNFLLQSERERRNQDFIEIKQNADLDYIILFKDYLEKNYKKEKRVSTYANQLQVTGKRLNQATSKVLGKSPKQMIDERIILEAKRLLAHTTKSVKEIGFDLGFDEPTNFIKYFRNHHDSTPVEFREQFSQ